MMEGDAFLSLHTEFPINEIHQYKCYMRIRISLKNGTLKKERKLRRTKTSLCFLPQKPSWKNRASKELWHCFWGQLERIFWAICRQGVRLPKCDE
jgi:hypothetical protein